MNEQLIIPILAGFSVILVGAAILVARQLRRAPLQERLRNLEGADAAGEITAAGAGSNNPRLSDVVGSIGQIISSGSASLTLQQQLTQAGYHHARAAAIYFGAKLILLVTGGLGASALVVPTQLQPHTKLLLIAMCSIILFFIPNIVVSSRRSTRRSEVRRHLPDAVDLLEICASAGMGLDMAWNSVTDEVRPVSSILADEMALTNLEIHLGANRATAMRHMAQRTGAEELSSMVAVLVQSERFGTSIGDALRTYAGAMREARSQYAQESAEKMAVKLIFPMVMFIFPAVVMVMAGPGFMMLYKALRAH
jgi:tight adherence protein C